MGHTPNNRRALLNLADLTDLQAAKVEFIKEQASSLSLTLLNRCKLMEQQERDAQDVKATVDVLDAFITTIESQHEYLEQVATKIRTHAL